MSAEGCRISRPTNVPLYLMYACVKPARSNCRLGGEEVHRRRIERRLIPLARHPSINEICPFLHHMAALMLVFGLIVYATRRPTILMRKAFSNPITIEPQLVQQRRTRAAQIVNGEVFQR